MSANGVLPNLLIIGAHKCGTTALHHYLSLHPEIFMSRTKELHFFVEELNWHRGLEWYQRYFRPGPPKAKSAKVYGESSPSYTNYPKYGGVPQRAYSVVPDAKLILMVRDPLDRIVSHYRMERARSDGRQTFTEAALRHFRNPYIWQSMYWMQLRQFLDYYPISRVLVATQEELFRERRATLRRVFRFLGVDDSVDDPEFDAEINTSLEREEKAFGKEAPPPTMTDEQRQKLVEHLQGDIEELRKHTGLRFDGWCV
jgi:hypothetical protein